MIGHAKQEGKEEAQTQFGSKIDDIQRGQEVILAIGQENLKETKETHVDTKVIIQIIEEIKQEMSVLHRLLLEVADEMVPLLFLILPDADANKHWYDPKHWMKNVFR